MSYLTYLCSANCYNLYSRVLYDVFGTNFLWLVARAVECILEAQAESLEACRAAVLKDVSERQEAFDASMKEARDAADVQISAISAEITRKLLA